MTVLHQYLHKTSPSVCQYFRHNLAHRTRIKRSASSVASNLNVYISTCYDVFHNLAFEDWIYSNVKLSNRDGALFLWRNKPCIVIGRHQNPWAECDVQSAVARNVPVARRRSGGGTVYHDLGNLNCTFVTSRKMYNRRMNLEVMAGALVKGWDLDVTISDRDDLVLNSKYKISGTASKLGRELAYHHCTLLFNVDQAALGSLLHSKMQGLQSRATESVRSEVANLQSLDPSITAEALMSAIAQEYLASHMMQTNIKYVDPTRESLYPGIHKMQQELRDWNWIYGKTPKFSVEKPVYFHDDMSNSEISLVINKGKIEDVHLKNGNVPESDATWFGRVQGLLCGTRFRMEDVALVSDELKKSQDNVNHEQRKFILTFLEDIFH